MARVSLSLGSVFDQGPPLAGDSPLFVSPLDQDLPFTRVPLYLGSPLNWDLPFLGSTLFYGLPNSQKTPRFSQVRHFRKEFSALGCSK